MADQNAVQLTYELTPSPRTASELQRQAEQLEKNLRFKSPFGQANREIRDFQSEMDRANQRVITLGASFAVLSTSIRTLKDIVKSTIEVEKAFTEINAVFGLTNKQLDSFSKGLFNVARDTSMAFDKAAEAAKEFSRQGLSAEETLKRTRDALILTRLAGLDVAQSVSTLTAAMNGFTKAGLSSTSIVNKLATVDASFAVSSKDLAEGLARAGAAASDAGVDFDQLIGLITAAQQTTARGGAAIGNALKSIFTRIEKKDTIEAFEALGVTVKDTSGNVLGAIPLLQNFATTYDKLNGSVKKHAAELVGGIYQINILKALLGDVAKANGVYAQSTDIAAHATDEAIKRNEALNQSLDSVLERLATTSKQIGSNIGNNTFLSPLKSILNIGLDNPITKALEDASGQAETTGGKIAQGLMRGIGGTLIYGLGPLIASALAKITTNTLRNLSRDFADLTGITTQGQEEAMIQKQVVDLYRAGGTALQEQLATMTSLTERAAYLQRLLSQTNPNTAGLMAETLYAGGYRARPRAAGGYVPMGEESAAIAAGVGGAPAGARPVYLPGFNRGGGLSGIVANTSEFITPKGAIFNRDMIRAAGLPPGSTPVAAGGFVPSAAGGFDYDSLRLKYGAVGGPGSGFLATKSQIDSLNEMFKQLAKAGSANEAYKIGPQIADFANELDKLSSKQVFKKLGEEINRFAYGANIAAGRANPFREVPLPSEGPTVAESIANRGFGDEYNDYLAMTYGGRGGRAQASTATYDAFGAYGPNRTRLQRYLPGVANLVSRLPKLSPTAGLGLALGAPFVGGLIGEGEGGTAGGILRGGASGFANGIGAGASIGSIIPGIGTFAGALVGGVGGGLYGALSKIETSFEDLARKIQDNNAKLGAQVTATNDIARLQQEFQEALKSGNVGKQKDIQTKITQAAAGIQDPEIRALLQSNDVASAIRMSNDKLGAVQPGQNLLSAVSGSLKTATAGFFGYGDDARGRISSAIQPIVSNLSPQQQRFYEQLADKDVSKALRSIGAMAGLDEKQQGALTDRLDSTFNIGGTRAKINTKVLFEEAIRDAFNSVRQNAISPLAKTLTEAAKNAVALTESLEHLSSQYQIQARDTQITAQGVSQLRTARQSILLARPDLTETGRLGLQGRFELQNIQEQGLFQRSAALSTGRASLFDVIRQLPSGPDSQPLRDRVTGFRNLGDVTAFRDLLNTQKGREQFPGVTSENGRFMKVLDDLIEKLSGLDKTEEMQLIVAKETNRLRMQEMQLMRTFAGARMQYGGAAMNASIAVADAFRRGDTPDILQNRLTEGNLKALENDYNRRVLYRVNSDPTLRSVYSDDPDLNRRYNSSYILRNSGQVNFRNATFPLGAMGGLAPMSSAAYYGRRAGIAANAEATSQANDAAAIRYLLSHPEAQGAADLTPERIQSGLMGGARQAGLRGNATGSFTGGFQSVFTAAKKDLMDFSAIGAQVADDLQNDATSAWSAWTTGAKKGKDAFREFTVSVLGDASRMLASKAFTAIFSSIPGFTVGPAGATGGEFTGSAFRFASGGKVPALLMGGEYVLGPRAARAVGYDALRRMNRYADGGPVVGGSGVRDDVPARLAPGSFVIRKSAAQRLGPEYLNALASGKVQHRAMGGFLGWGSVIGGLIGGGIGYLTGGKKGAIGGALLGGIGGGLYGMNQANAAGMANEGSLLSRMGPATLSIGEKAAIGLGASAGLGLLSAGIMGGKKSAPGPISLDQVAALRSQLESDQQQQLAGRGAGQQVFLQINPQGGYSLAGFDSAPATRRWASGGAAYDSATSAPTLSLGNGSVGGSGAGSNGPAVYVKIEINNNGAMTSSASAAGGNGDRFGADFGSKIERVVRPIVQDELVRQSRSDGFFTQKSRFVGGT